MPRLAGFEAPVWFSKSLSRGSCLDRREFMKRGGSALLAAGAAGVLPAQMKMPADSSPQAGAKADITLHIAPVTVDLAPNHIISTIGYNGISPGPVLRMPKARR